MIAYLDNQPLIDGDGPSDDPLNSSASDDASIASTDFGGLVSEAPLALLRPSSAAEVARCVNLALSSTPVLTLAARGNGHSVAGQAMAPDGLVLDMRAMGGCSFELVKYGRAFYVDVPAGALWEDVLDWSVRLHGLAPPSWTDYLGLTVGGTLSVGGVSGQAFRYGPQVCSVGELEIVIGDGERRVCSPESEPELFYGALGGLGQLGVITRARVRLVPAHQMVRWVRVVYGSFGDYVADAEALIRCGGESESFDYVEGFAFVNDVADPVNGWGSVPVPSGSPFDPTRFPFGPDRVLYCLEVALYYNHRESDRVDERVEGLLRPLRFVRGLKSEADVGYVEFLSRVKKAEEEARANGLWDGPHPWLNILVGSTDIADFEKRVFREMLKDGIGGPMLVYPLLASKWDRRMTLEAPASEVFYLVALLRFPSRSDVDRLVSQNKEILDLCRRNGYDYKVYIPHYENTDDWIHHFEREHWHRLVQLKNRYDSLAIFAPGQKIFSRV